MIPGHSTGSRSHSGPSLIAWLSLCLLAAAWGRTLDANLQRVWAEVGAFGLATAVGLEAVHRACMARERQVRERFVRRRVEHGLSRLIEQSATLDAMSLAVRRLIEDVTRRKGPQPCSSGWTKRHCEAEILLRYPIEITSVDDSSTTVEAGSYEPTRGSIRQMSATSISFDHAEPLPTRVAIATFRLSRGEKFSVVVDLIWTEKDGDGYVSGGTVLAAGAPREPEPLERDLAEVGA